MHKTFLQRLLASAALCACVAAHAQSYPAKPIRLVVPYPAGSASDIIMRMLSEKMQPELKQSIVIDARPGGGTAIAVRYVMSQPADGYTLYNYTSSSAIKSAVKDASFDVRKDLTHIVSVITAPPILAVNPEKVPVKTVPELIAFVKANPGKLNFSNYGYGTLSHLCAVLLTQQAGLNVVHVPYKGPVANVLSLSTGDSQITFDGKGELGKYPPDKVRMLAVSTAERSPLSPDLPGMRESGLPDFDMTAILSLAGPAGLPAPIVRTVNAAANVALKDKSLIDGYLKLGLVATGGTPEQITAQVNREVETMRKIIHDADLNIE
jgi:tripartite-type tricarboxylate transporter receptor subunit TctC